MVIPLIVFYLVTYSFNINSVPDHNIRLIFFVDVVIFGDQRYSQQQYPEVVGKVIQNATKSP